MINAFKKAYKLAGIVVGKGGEYMAVIANYFASWFTNAAKFITWYLDGVEGLYQITGGNRPAQETPVLNFASGGTIERTMDELSGVVTVEALTTDEAAATISIAYVTDKYVITPTAQIVKDILIKQDGVIIERLLCEEHGTKTDTDSSYSTLLGKKGLYNFELVGVTFPEIRTHDSSIYCDANEVGYSVAESGDEIPVGGWIPALNSSQDINLNNLTYKGKASQALEYVAQNCLLGDGTASLLFANLPTYDESVVTEDGVEAAITITADEWTPTNLKKYNDVILKNSGAIVARFPLNDFDSGTSPSSVIYSDVMGTGATLTLQNGTLPDNLSDRKGISWNVDKGYATITADNKRYPALADGSGYAGLTGGEAGFKAYPPINNGKGHNDSEQEIKAIDNFDLREKDEYNIFLQPDGTPNEIKPSTFENNDYIKINKDDENNVYELRIVDDQNIDFDFAIADGSQALDMNIRFPAGKSIRVYWGDGLYDDYLGNDNISVNLTHIYSSSGTYPITFGGYYLYLTYLNCYGNSLTGDVSGWSALTNLTYLDCSSNSLTGDISGWSALTNLTTLSCSNNSLTGDISGWSALTSLTYLNCYSNSLTGDISGWSALTSLTYLNCRSNSLTGDISGWSALTSLTYLNCRNNSLTGDVSGWSALTSLTYLSCSSNSLTGDVSGWSALTSLTTLECRNNSLTFNSNAAWTSHNHDVYAYDNAMTSEMVDNMLIAFSGGDFGTKIISIAGTNAARTTASDAALTDLEADGNTVTVNE